MFGAARPQTAGEQAKKRARESPSISARFSETPLRNLEPQHGVEFFTQIQMLALRNRLYQRCAHSLYQCENVWWTGLDYILIILESII